MSRYFTLFLSSSLFLAACQPTQQLTIEGKDGSSTTTVNISEGSSPYPGDFPVPQYPGSKVHLTQNSTLTEGSGGTTTIMLTTADPGAKTVLFYKDWFNNNGWKITAEITLPGTLNINAEKADQTIMVTACSNQGANGLQTAITLVKETRK